MIELLFWLCVTVVFYTYFGYPLILWALHKVFHKKIDKGSEEPLVSVIISVFNEEDVIERKLQSLLQQDYPEEKIEILVGSDGALDKTDEIISKFHSPRIRFFRFVKNRGKPHVLNGLVREAHGAVVIFTDARQEFSKHAIKTLAANFHDPTVGCVSGEMHFRDVRGEAVGKGMNLYWTYEKFIRKCESGLGSMVGATGAIYAIQRKLYDPIPEDVLVDDMYIPLMITGKGYRVIFEPAAFAYDRTSARGTEEMRRKVRTLSGNFQIFRSLPFLFDPRKSSVAWQIFSHKFLRLMIPYFLAGIMFFNIFLASTPFYLILLALQIVFYALAIHETFNEYLRPSKGPNHERRKNGIGYIPYTFCLLNYAAFLGLIAFLSKKQKVAWKR